MIHNQFSSFEKLRAVNPSGPATPTKTNNGSRPLIAKAVSTAGPIRRDREGHGNLRLGQPTPTNLIQSVVVPNANTHLTIALHCSNGATSRVAKLERGKTFSVSADGALERKIARAYDTTRSALN